MYVNAYNNAFTVLNYFDTITETDNRFFEQLISLTKRGELSVSLCLNLTYREPECVVCRGHNYTYAICGHNLKCLLW